MAGVKLLLECFVGFCETAAACGQQCGQDQDSFFHVIHFLFIFVKNKNRPANKAVGEFTNQLIIDSAAFEVLRPLLYGRQLPDPISPRPGINNDTNTMKHRINDVCYLHRISQACDSPEQHPCWFMCIIVRHKM